MTGNDAKAIREARKQSQERFAQDINMSVACVRSNEQRAEAEVSTSYRALMMQLIDKQEG